MSKKVVHKRINGQGTLENRRGIWFVRYVDPLDGKRKRITTGETDKIKAEAFLRNRNAEQFLTAQLKDDKARLFHLQAKLQNSIAKTKADLMDLKKIPIKEMYTRLFVSEQGKKYRPKDISRQTEKQYERFCRKFYTWLENNHPSITTLDLISHDLVGDFLQSILDSGKKDLHRRILTLVRSVFERYVEMGLLFQNPFNGYHNEKNIGVVKKRILTEEEMDKLHDYLKTQDKETQGIFIFCEETGQRFGDVCNLKFSYFRKETVEGNEVFILKYKPRKTQKFGTVVEMPISKNCVSVLEERKKENPESEYLFPAWQKLYSQNNSCYANKKINGIIKDAGIETTNAEGKTVVGIHSLRHGFVSSLAFSSSNIPLATIQAMVGHTREDMTEYYTESKVKDQLKAIASINAQKESETGVLVLPRGLLERIEKNRGKKTVAEYLDGLISGAEDRDRQIEAEEEKKLKRIEEIIDRKI